MKIFLLLLPLLLVLGGCGKEPVEEAPKVTKYVPHEGAINRSKLEWRDGLYYEKSLDTPFTGMTYQVYPDGQKMKEGTIKDDKEDGLWLSWHENGQKSGEKRFENGKLEGKFFNWYESGQKESQGFMENGKEEELHVTWHENGNKKSERSYENGKGEGLLVTWYENGNKESQGSYENDKAEGEFFRWHENGQMASEETFTEGEKISEKYWNRKGEIIDFFDESKCFSGELREQLDLREDHLKSCWLLAAAIWGVFLSL